MCFWGSRGESNELLKRGIRLSPQNFGFSEGTAASTFNVSLDTSIDWSQVRAASLMTLRWGSSTTAGQVSVIAVWDEAAGAAVGTMILQKLEPGPLQVSCQSSPEPSVPTTL